jgi:uracil phosphoribosyltransferase
MPVTLVDHPLVQHKLSILRDRHTSVRDFRAVCIEMTALMAFEALRQLPLEEVEVETPLARTMAKRLAGKKLAVVAILRAGLIMVDGILQLVPSARVGHLGLYRDEATLQPVQYFAKLPSDLAQREVIVVDPMLATGGSAVAALQELRKRGVLAPRLLCILAAPEGVAAVEAAAPGTEVIVAALDERLNEHGFIVPGLGDAGDRMYGTR